MAEFDSSQLRPDELFLSGKLQLDTAIDVLEMTGLNQSAVEYLAGILRAHELTTSVGAKDDLKIYLQGGVTQAMKADIVASALESESNPIIARDRQIAARELLEVLGISI